MLLSNIEGTKESKVGLYVELIIRPFYVRFTTTESA
jgi:hypothetical protein